MIVIFTALGVGGATVMGSVIGFMFKHVSHRFRDLSMSFAAGVMLAAAILGLILPSLEYSGKNALPITVTGFFTGAGFLTLLDRVVPHMHALVGIDALDGPGAENLNRVLLFIAAIAIHNFPEGIAAGVSFGSGSIRSALLIAGGIALQNIPEGMILITPMLSAGISPKRTFLCALASGMVEVLGTFLGYFAVTLASSLLPFALAFAGGTILYVISDEMIPDTHAHGNERGATYALLIGFCVMLISDVLLG